MNQAEQQQRFEQWTLAHHRILHHAVNAFAQPSDRDDLMQDVLIAVWKAIPAYRGASSPATFLYRVSHNAAMTWRRARGNYQRLLAQAAREPVAVSAAARARPDDRLEALYAAIRDFAPLDRSLLLLSLDDLSYREIAEIHGISENLVGVRLTRARAKLMHQLKEHR